MITILIINNNNNTKMSTPLFKSFNLLNSLRVTIIHFLHYEFKSERPGSHIDPKNTIETHYVQSHSTGQVTDRGGS